jgi:3-hydroxybutyryl-CoA dehydratase
MVIHVNELDGYDIEDLEIGMRAIFAKTVTEADIVLFAAASGDNNAIHINEEFARTTQFKGRIAHGMLSPSVISAAIAGHLPGPGTIYMGQNLRFVALPEKCRVRLSTICTVKGEMVVDGEALVMTTSRKARES